MKNDYGLTVRIKARWLAVLLGVLLLAAIAVLATEAAQRIPFAIESQPVATALNAFARQAHLMVLRRDEEVSLDGMQSPRIEGEMSAAEALMRILSKTDLTFEFVNQRTVRIRRGVTSPTGDRGRRRDLRAVVLSEAIRVPSAVRRAPHVDDRVKTVICVRLDQRSHSVVASAHSRPTVTSLRCVPSATPFAFDAWERRSVSNRGSRKNIPFDDLRPLYPVR